MAPAITAPPMTSAATPGPHPIRGAATERRHPSQSRSKVSETNESSATLSGPRAQAPLLRKFDLLHWLS